ncbi:MAG: peptide chain release factor aRF-1 [Thermoproteales archaeon]|nr:peptide chain release factor aRF-1 [Thermoproteales archaeon]
MSSDIGRFKLEKMIRELKEKRGRGTELISLYIPAGRPIGDVMSVLRQEYSTATNIKDRTTRHHVLEALTAVMQRLKLFKQTPPHGLIIFAGYVAGDAPGDEKMEVHLIEPPQRLRMWLYRCDSRFHTEILEDMIKVEDVYGLIVLDRSEAAFAVLRGKNLEVVEEITSGIPGKHRSGGQSARRFERIIEQLAHEFYKRIGEHANRIFLKIPELKGIIVGGPGYSKEEFVEGDYLHYTLKEKIIGVFDVGYSGESGIYELLVRAKDLLKDVRYMKEKEVMNRFLYHLSRDTGLAVYGEDEVRKALDMGALDKLLLSEDLEKYRIKFKCIQCGYEGETTVKSLDDVLRCPKCGGEVQVIEEKTLIDEFVEKAKNSGAEVILVSSSTSEGKELLKTFGGIAGLLRFKI